MALYAYRGRTATGDTVEGVLDAVSKEAAAGLLMADGVTLLQLNEREEAEQGMGWWQHLREPKPTLDDLIFFSRQMYSLLKAGVPILRAIHGLSETTRNARMVRVLHDMSDGLTSGRALSVCLARHPEVFDHLYISMVRVGEDAGQLDTAFMQMARYLELEKDTRTRVKAALRYPTFVIIAITIAMTIINLFVIPAFSDVFSGFNLELPWATRFLLGLSNFFVAYWPLMLVTLIVSAIAVRRYVETDGGRYQWDRMKLRIPIVGDILLRTTLARFARAFAISFRAGVPLLASLAAVAHAVDNAFVAAGIDKMRDGIERGDTLTRTAASTGLFTSLVLQMLAVGEETGSVDDMLEEAADFYEREVDHDIKYLGEAIEPLLIVSVGVMVLILALGVFLPMWNLTSIAHQG